jgi:hypothetical protein
LAPQQLRNALVELSNYIDFLYFGSLPVNSFLFFDMLIFGDFVLGKDRDRISLAAAILEAANSVQVKLV